MAKTESQNAAFANFESMTAAPTEAARRTMERSMNMMGDMAEVNKQGMAAFAESAKAATQAVETFSSRASAFAKDAMEDMVSTGRSVSTAKSVKEAMEIQAEYAKSAFDRYLEEVNAMTGLFAASLKNCMEPVNAQAGEYLARMQARV